MDLPTHSDSIIVARSSDDLYAMVADVTRMGQYSPICKECWWDEGGGPRVGAHFTGRNVLRTHVGDAVGGGGRRTGA